MDSRILRAKLVVSILTADGIMTPDEKSFLHGYMDELGLVGEERDQVIAIDPNDDLVARARALALEDRQSVVDWLLKAALADGRLSPYEIEQIGALSRALGVGQRP